MSVWVTERCGSHRRRMHLCPSCCISPLVPMRSSCGAFCGVWLRLRLRRSLIYCHLPLRLWLRLLLLLRLRLRLRLLLLSCSIRSSGCRLLSCWQLHKSPHAQPQRLSSKGLRHRQRVAPSRACRVVDVLL